MPSLGTKIIYNSDLIVRGYENASFLMHAKSQQALLLEGPLSWVAIDLTSNVDFALPQSFLAKYDAETHPSIRTDFNEVKDSVLRFLANGSTGESSDNNGEADKSEALGRLAKFAAANWIPTTVNIELTNKCNQRCQFCFQDDFTKRGLSLEMLQRIGFELHEAGTIFVSFTGGEIFIRRDAMEILGVFNEIGFALEIKTNGTLLTKEIIRHLSTLKIIDVQVSLYETVSGESSLTGGHYNYRQVIANIQMLRDAGLSTSISITVGTHNIAQLEEIHTKLELAGLADIVFYNAYITPNRRGSGEEAKYRLSYAEIIGVLRPFLKRIKKFFPMTEKYRDCETGSAPCKAGRNQLAIDPEGWVFPCLDLPMIRLGNLQKTSLMKILKMREAAMAQFSFCEMTSCQKCDIQDYCDSCVGAAILNNGDYRIPYRHKCDMSRFFQPTINV